ncbi:MAG: 50S ribosomal protein L9 [Synergistales bacterium]|nr:50S ribosomal protein L9 [Synergistales bacterium]
MKIILKDDVNNVGKAGDLAEVADGYARNFLIPRGLAEQATQGRLKSWKQEQKVRERREQKAREAAEAQQKKLQGRQVRVKVNTGEAGKLFGSVTASDLAEAIEKQIKQKVDRREIQLSEPIKELGVFPFAVRLYPGVEAELTASVESE